MTGKFTLLTEDTVIKIIKENTTSHSAAMPENAGNLAVFPEKAAATGLGLVAVILDSIDQNDVRFDVFLHVGCLHSNDFRIK